MIFNDSDERENCGISLRQHGAGYAAVVYVVFIVFAACAFLIGLNVQKNTQKNLSERISKAERQVDARSADLQVAQGQWSLRFNPTQVREQLAENGMKMINPPTGRVVKMRIGPAPSRVAGSATDYASR